MPNITHTFKRSSFSFQFSAARDIKAGEQLFYAYCNVNQTASERKADLAPYGVVCQCICCANATPNTDKLRREFICRIAQYRVDAERWAKMPNLSVSVLKPVLELKEEMIKEGLHSQVQAYSILLEACLRIYVQLGMKEKLIATSRSFVITNLCPRMGCDSSISRLSPVFLRFSTLLDFEIFSTE